MLFELPIWGCGAPRHGGFEEKKHDQRSGACQLLEGLLDLSLPHAADQVLDLYFDQKWHHNWPRPPAITPDVPKVSITISKGFFDLESWTALAMSTSPGDVAAKRAWQDLNLHRLVKDHGKSVHISKLFCAVAASDVHRFLLAQLAAGVANLMEATWLGTSASSTSVREAIGFQWLDIDEGFEKRFQVDRKLYAYVTTCGSCRADWQYMTMGSDKGDAPGMLLTHPHMAFPDNQAFVAVPQVGCLPKFGCQPKPKKSKRLLVELTFPHQF